MLKYLWTYYIINIVSCKEVIYPLIYKEFAYLNQIGYTRSMTIIANILPYIQIILAIILTGAILLQQSGAGVGGALGGGDGGGLYHTRRGFEKFLFVTTIVAGILFTASAFVAILV